MRRKRLVLLGAAAMAAATALSGCVGFGGPGGAGGGQIDVIGDVDVTAGVCRSGTPGCISTNATTYPEVNMQLLAAFQIADAIAAPSTISITSGPQIGVFLDPSPSYSAELQRLAPAPAGSRWVGYISPAFTYRSAVEPASGTLLARFRLTQPGGQPVRGLGYSRVVGARGAVVGGAPEVSPSRPVACGSTLDAFNTEQGSDGFTICRDGTGGGFTSTRDLGVSAVSPETARPGELATVAFSLAYAGTAAPTANFTLDATTTLSGADPNPAPGTLQPATDSTTRVQVAIPVPAGARPGTYEVALTARLANGQTRRGVGSLRIVAAAAGAGPGGVVTGGSGRAGSARCAGVPATIVGTAKPNVIRGTAKADVIASLGGPDVVRGLGGDDLICLGAGADRGIGGAGEDRVLGQAGPDQLAGGAATDQLVGGGGNDTLRGGGGADLLDAGKGRLDRAIGGAGADSCTARRLVGC